MGGPVSVSLTQGSGGEHRSVPPMPLPALAPLSSVPRTVEGQELSDQIERRRGRPRNSAPTEPPSRRPRGRPKGSTGATYAAVLRLFDRGRPPMAIAAKVGVSFQRVYQILKAA